MTRKPSKGYLLVDILVISPAMYLPGHMQPLSFTSVKRGNLPPSVSLFGRQIANPEI